MKKLTYLILILLAPFAATAHSGHGEWHGTVLHYVGSFWHMLPLVLFIVLVAYLVKRSIAYRKKT